MIVDLLLILLWTAAGSIAAIPQGRFGWAALPLGAGAISLVARRLNLRWFLLPRRTDGWAAFGAGWAGTVGYLAATSEWREVMFPAVAVAAAGLFLFHERSALQSHGIVTAGVVAAAVGASLDPGARQLPLFFPFLAFLVLAVALVQQEYIHQRLRDAARHGNLLAQQIPGYGGARRGLVPALAVVTVTTCTLAAALYIGVPRFRLNPSDPQRREGGRGGHTQTGIAERMSLRAVQDLKMDYRVALRLRLFEDGRPVRPALPARLRSSAVDRMDGGEWVSTATWSTVVDTADGRADGWISLRGGAVTQPLEQQYELEPAEVPLLYAMPDAARVNRASLRLATDGAMALAHIPRERTSYTVISDVSGVDPRFYEAAPRHPDPRFTSLPLRDPRIRALALEVTAGARTAWKKAALIEEYLRSNYEYTLEFDPGDREPVQSFLFVTRAGFCVHFASAMAVMLRSLDIPCRIAQGLSGGEWSEREMCALFRLSDAHAWVEVWLGQMAGWVSFDPTPATTFGEEDPDEFARGGGGPPDVRRPGDPAGTLTADKLSKLDLKGQRELVSGLWATLGGFFRTRTGRVLLILVVMAVSLGITWRLLPRHERRRLRAALLGGGAGAAGFWEEFVALAARAGLHPAVGETPFEFAKRVDAVYPGARRVALALYAVRFGGAPAGEEESKVRAVIDGMRAAQAGKRAPAGAGA